MSTAWHSRSCAASRPAHSPRGERAGSYDRCPMRSPSKLTNRCNLRCHHCYQWGDDGHHRTLEAEDRNRDLDISVVAKVLDATRQRGANVFLWGGEPLFIPTGTTSSPCSLRTGAGRQCAPTASTSKSASTRY